MIALACCVSLSACDDAADKDRKDLQAAGAAMLGEGKDDKTKEIEAKEAEERKQMFEDKQKAEAEITAKLDAIAARLVKAPDKPTKDIETACDAILPIYEDWIKKIYFDDDGFQLNFFDNKAKELGKVKARCAKLQSVEAMDCVMEVIRGVQPEDFPESDAKIVQGRPDYLFNKCIEQFAPDKQANWETLIE